MIIKIAINNNYKYINDNIHFNLLFMKFAQNEAMITKTNTTR